MTHRPHPNPTRRGFSLIEILVVIAIVGVVAGLLIAAGVPMRESSQRSQTKAVLGQLAGVLT